MITDWEQQLDALQGLGRAELFMRKPGDWCVSIPYVSIGGDGMLRGTSGNGPNPVSAVADMWQKYTKPAHDLHIIIDRPGGPRRHVEWNGYMWADLPAKG